MPGQPNDREMVLQQTDGGIIAAMIPLNEQRRASRQLHAIAEKIDGFTREFHDESTKGTGIEELVGEAKQMLLEAASRTPLMGLPAAEQAKLAKSLKLGKL